MLDDPTQLECIGDDEEHTHSLCFNVHLYTFYVLTSYKKQINEIKNQ